MRLWTNEQGLFKFGPIEKQYGMAVNYVVTIEKEGYAFERLPSPGTWDFLAREVNSEL